MDPVAATLTELGHDPGSNPIRALDSLLRRDPKSARAIASALTPHLARLAKEQAAAATYALGGANLALGEAALARELLVEAGALAANDAALSPRIALRLAQAELAAKKPKPARLHAARAFSGLLALGDSELVDDLARVLTDVGENLAAEAVAHLRRAAPAKSDRSLVLARLVAMLNSCAAGTAEPLFTVLRAVIDETRAARGCLMLHEGPSLRFELGLTRSGRRLSADDFACSTTIVDKALETARPVLVPDLSAVLPFAMASSARSLGLRSALCAPLKVDRRRSGGAQASASLPHVKGIAGVLYVDSEATGSFTEDDAAFFEALADAAVLALRASGGKPARRETKDEPREAFSFGPLTTRAPTMRTALELAARVAPTDASVLLRGESGTGKELFARAIHAHGRRAQGPFVAVECGALSEHLVHHELFGHEEGAFTGAGPARAGLIERAHGGTLYLDEVADMPATMQAALLRVLQEGEVRRIGGGQPRPVNVRLVASTQRDLSVLVERGAFRHDLLFRLAVVEIRIPPLRERRVDFASIADDLLKRIGEKKSKFTLDDAALARLEEHGWPGNVRELENVLRVAALACLDGAIGLREIEDALGARKVEDKPAAPPQSLDGTIEEIERRAIVERLERLEWNQVRVAESLGMDRTTLRRKMTRYGIVRGRD